MPGSRSRSSCLLAVLSLAAACAQPSGEAAVAGGAPGAAVVGHFQMENLDRGVVAVQVATGVYVGWRMLGWEYDAADPSTVSYEVSRDGVRIALVTDSTNYLDPEGTAGAIYTVRAIVNGLVKASSPATPVWAQNYLRVPLQLPPGGTTEPPCSDAGTAYTYSANDGSVGDLDGDGAYELVLKWDPSNAKDNAQSGCTGNVYLDAYELDGTRLWRIDLGRNIRAGAHYTQFVVYDLDGDGKAELAVKTAPGARDGTGAYLRTGPAAEDDDAADHRNASGYVLSGPEYLTVFAGATGAELATALFDVPRGNVGSWGDTYGNRVDRFLASVGFVSDAGDGSRAASGRPSVLMARGYYTRATITAWNWRDGALTEIWRADSNAGTAFAGQGAHTMAMADVDGDGAQEVVHGASVINSDGTARCQTGLGHGDALHVGVFVPGRDGLQVFMPHEEKTRPSWDLHDASTCEVLQQGAVRNADTGRGVAGDVFAGNPGAELWANGSGGIVAAATGANAGAMPASTNFLVWWDADESRELEDGVSVTKYGGGVLLTCGACASNNGTKATPVLTADLLGDWREEVIWRESDDAALRIYTTTDVTSRRLYTLMHDPQYRAQVSSQQTGYNQPPHPSFAIGSGMSPPPRPDITAPGNPDPSYTLTIAVRGDGTTSPPAGAGSYPEGTVVRVTAVAAPGATFVGWSGAAAGTENPVSITMDGDESLTATFVPNHTLTIAARGKGTTDPAPGSRAYPDGTVVTVTAIPEEGARFKGWCGAATGTTNPLTVTVSSDATLTAIFSGGGNKHCREERRDGPRASGHGRR